jgi:hypothetical protein
METGNHNPEREIQPKYFTVGYKWFNIMYLWY